MRSRVKSNNIAYDHLIEGFSVNSSLYGSSLLLSEEASAPTTPAAATGNEESTAPPNWLLDEVRTYPLIISISSSVLPSSLVLQWNAVDFFFTDSANWHIHQVHPKKVKSESTLRGIHSVVIFCRAFLTCSTGRWAEMKLQLLCSPIYWWAELLIEDKTKHHVWGDDTQCSSLQQPLNYATRVTNQFCVFAPGGKSALDDRERSETDTPNL